MTMPMRSLTPFSWNRSFSNDRSDPFVALQHEMNRLFDNFSNVPLVFGNFSGGDGGQAAITPRINVAETDKQIEIEAELPGVSEKDIDVTVSGDMLTLRAERQTASEDKRKNYFVSERSYGSFFRSIALPFDAEPGDIVAHFDRGLLKIIVKKPERVSAKTARIPVSAKS